MADVRNKYKVKTPAVKKTKYDIGNFAFDDAIPVNPYRPIAADWEHEADYSSDDPGFFSRVLDVVSRPLYAVSNVIKDTIDPDPATDNPAESFWMGLSGVDKTTGSDILSKADDVWFNDTLSNETEHAGGLFWDLAADPVNYIPFGKIATAAKLPQGIKKIDAFLKGDHKIPNLNRYTEEQIKERGGFTEQIIPEGTVDEAPQRMPSPSQLDNRPTIHADPEDVFDPTPGSPSNARTREKAETWTPPNNDPGPNPFARIGPGGTRVNYRVSPDGNIERVVAGTTARPMEPIRAELGEGLTTFQANTDATVTPIREAQTRFNAGPEGVIEDIRGGNVPEIKYSESKELVPTFDRKYDIPDEVITPPRGNVNPVETATSGMMRTFETGPSNSPDMNLLRANDIPQAYKVRDIVQGLTDEIRNFPPGSDDFKLYREVEFQNRIRADKDAMFAAGDPPVGRFANENYAIHFADVADSLDPRYFNRMMFNPRVFMPFSSIYQGALAAMKARNLGLMGDRLEQFIKDAMVQGHKIPGRTIHKSELDRAVRQLIKGTNKLQVHLVKNEQKLGNNFTKGAAVGHHIAKEMEGILTAPGVSVGKELELAADFYGRLNREARSLGLSPGDTMRARQALVEGPGRLIDESDSAAARDTLAAIKAAEKGNEGAARGRLLDTYIRDAQENARQSSRDAGNFGRVMAEEVPPGATPAAHADLFADTSERAALDYLSGFNRAYRKFRRLFIAGAEQGGFFGVRRMTQNTVEDISFVYNETLREIQKKYGDDVINNMGNSIQSGKKITDVDASLREVYKDVERMMRPHFDPASAYPTGGLFTNTITWETANIFLQKAFGKGTKHQLKGEYPGQQASSLIHQLNEWKIDNWTDFLSRIEGANVKVSVLAAMARHAEAMGSSVPKAGYSRVAQTDFEKSPISHLINPERHIPDHVIEDLRIAQEELISPVHWGQSETRFGKFMANVFDPMLNIWKTFATFLRPGHHARNMYGDTLINFTEKVGKRDYQVANSAYYAMGGSNRLTFEELTKAWKGEDVTDAMKGAHANDHAFTVHLKGGQQVHQTNGQFGQNNFRYGGSTNFQRQEELDTLSKIGSDQVLNRLINTRYGRTLEKWSDWNSNMQRMALVARKLRDPRFTKQFDKLEDAYAGAIEYGYRAHPDVNGITAFEKKYGRRIIPFYAYNRQILPWAVTAFAMRPGRWMAIPKVQYAIAGMAGGDPESIGQPTTDSALLPPWARGLLSGNFTDRENAGMGFNMGYEVGSPMDTLAGWFNNSPNPAISFGSELGKSVNPYLSFPAEVFDPSQDKSEVIDERIPGGSTFKSITGISPSGTVGNWGTGNFNDNFGLDPTRQIARGQKNYLFNESLINFFTGLGIQDFSDYAGPKGTSLRENMR